MMACFIRFQIVSWILLGGVFSNSGWGSISHTNLCDCLHIEGHSVSFPVSLSSEQTDSFPLSVLYLSEYVGIESVTGNEKRAGEFLQYLAIEKGLKVKVFTDETDSYNFAASLYPLDRGKPNIILLNHIDVVPSGNDSLWEHPPFSGAIEEGYVWGRGAIDNKGMGIMQLMALADFVGLAEENDLEYNVTMLSVSNEEKGGDKGAALVVNQYLDDLNPVAVYGEGGTGLMGIVETKPDLPFFGIETAQKSGLWFSVSFSDPASGHGSIPRANYPAKQLTFGTSSLLNQKQPLILTDPAKDMLREIGKHEKGLRGIALRNIGFFRHFIGGTLRADPITNALLTNTITLSGLFTSEGSYNQVAYKATAIFDSRLLPGTDSEAFLRDVAKHFDLEESQIHIISQSPRSGISDTGPYYDALENAVYEVFGDVAVATILFPAHNDNVFFRAKGIPSYGLLPVILPLELVESIHNINERMSIKALLEGIEVYKALLNSLINP